MIDPASYSQIMANQGYQTTKHQQAPLSQDQRDQMARYSKDMSRAKVGSVRASGSQRIAHTSQGSGVRQSMTLSVGNKEQVQMMMKEQSKHSRRPSNK